MIQTVILAFSLLLITSFAQAQPSAELEAQPVDENTWRINLEIDDLENVFGVQAKFVFPDNNLVPISKKFEHHKAWPQQGKIQLRNFIQAESAEYAVSLVRPAKSMMLSGSVLSFEVSLLEAKPTQLVLDTLKVSDENGVVTLIDLDSSQLMIGEEGGNMIYFIGAVLLVMLFLCVTIVRKKRSLLHSVAV